MPSNEELQKLYDQLGSLRKLEKYIFETYKIKISRTTLGKKVKASRRGTYLTDAEITKVREMYHGGMKKADLVRAGYSYFILSKVL